jgi:predicted ATPase
LGKTAVSPEKFSTFGELLKYLRKREELTQREFAILVGYSDTQISRLEQNQRVPDTGTLQALFVPALHLQHEPQWVERLLELARQARLGELPETGKTVTPNNLPALLTTFIGREKEQAEILQLIRTHRLVTLTGSGGVGKTRISLQVGGQVLDQYANGVWLAELAPLSDPELVPQTVASIFGILSQSSRSHTELLINFLRPKTALLILDNCEHLLDASVRLADTLLKYCPQLKILATSREALGILGEIVYHMPSLGLPDIQQTLEHFREYESVRLFEERAWLAQPDFKLTMENASSIAQICSRLDGIPLAIELAAARVNMFSTAQIAARLNDRFNLLTGGSRTALPRQQTLRASIDWSWNLLSDPEHVLIRRLTVFAGGWTLEAAESVCSAIGDIKPPDVSELMIQLVAKSLVIANRQPGRERRFHLHETIRQYAHEKLIEAGEQENIHSQHLNYFLDLSERAETALHGPQQIEWYQRLTDERDNLRVALAHASGPDASKADLEAGLSISAKLVDYWVASD